MAHNLVIKPSAPSISRSRALECIGVLVIAYLRGPEIPAKDFFPLAWNFPLELVKKMEDSGNEKITLNFKLLTGGTFAVSVDRDISVDLLKKIVSRKLKINKDKICLMSSER